jgi:tetratricopeptide (TPR) repeat protein
MSRRSIFTVIVMFAGSTHFAMTMAEASADEPTSWKGKIVVMKRRGVKMGHTDDAGKQVYTAKLTNISYRVLDDLDGWVKVRHEKAIDWFDKGEAVLAEDAPAYFTEVIRRSPEDQWYARRAQAWRILFDFDKCLADYAQAIRMKPSETAWYGNRAWIYFDRGDYESALRDIEHLLRIANPPEAWMYADRGLAHSKLKDYDKATADFARALRMDPENDYIFNDRGLMWIDRKEYDNGNRDFTTVLRINPNHMWAYNNRGWCKIWKGDYAGAKTDLEKAIAMEPQADNVGNLAWLLATAADAKFRDGKRALELAKQAVEMSYHKSANSLSALAAAFAAVGDFDNAVRYQEKALEDKTYWAIWGEDAQKWLAGYRAKKPNILVAQAGKSATAPVEDAADLPKVTRVESGPIKGWREFQAPDGSFTIAFPEQPKANKRRISSPVGNIENHYFTHTQVDVTYLASYFDLPSDGLISLDTAMSNYTRARNGRVTNQKNISASGNPGREATMTVPDGSASRIRIVQAGQRQFQIVIDGPLEQVTSAQATAYLDSFRPTKRR